MCNLYHVNKPRGTLALVFDAQRRGQEPDEAPGDIFPDRLAPIIRLDKEGAREMQDARWGFPPPPKLGNRPVTNVRNLSSNYWRTWLKPEFRCLVPATKFCEWTDSTPKKQRWFAPPDGSTFAFAGIWRVWSGVRGTKAAPAEGEHMLFSFLTTEANEVVRPIHAKAMPVVLSNEAAWEAWLTAPIDEAIAMQRPTQPETMALLPEEQPQGVLL